MALVAMATFGAKDGGAVRYRQCLGLARCDSRARYPEVFLDGKNRETLSGMRSVLGREFSFIRILIAQRENFHRMRMLARREKKVGEHALIPSMGSRMDTLLFLEE